MINITFFMVGILIILLRLIIMVKNNFLDFTFTSKNYQFKVETELTIQNKNKAMKIIKSNIGDKIYSVHRNHLL